MITSPNAAAIPTVPSAPPRVASVTIAPQPANTSANAANPSAAQRRASDGRIELRRRHQLVGVLARQARRFDLSGDSRGVVQDALDRRPDLSVAGERQQRERRARIAVLRLSDRAAVDEQHAAVL